MKRQSLSCDYEWFQGLLMWNFVADAELRIYTYRLAGSPALFRVPELLCCSRLLPISQYIL